MKTKKFIDKDFLWNEIQHIPFYNNADRDAIEDLILSIQTANVQEVKHGRRTNLKKNCLLGFISYNCSECNKSITVDEVESLLPYCPYCGTKMDL